MRKRKPLTPLWGSIARDGLFFSLIVMLISMMFSVKLFWLPGLITFVGFMIFSGAVIRIISNFEWLRKDEP